MTRTVEETMQLPYTIEISRLDEGDGPYWFAQVAELPGCTTDADTLESLPAMIDEAIELWLETAVEANLPIPEPRPT